jgi:hypothetical protein
MLLILILLILALGGGGYVGNWYGGYGYNSYGVGGLLPIIVIIIILFLLLGRGGRFGFQWELLGVGRLLLDLRYRLRCQPRSLNTTCAAADIGVGCMKVASRSAPWRAARPVEASTR